MINQDYQIVFLISKIHRSSGGLSSALDMAESAQALNYKVNLCIITEFGLYFIRYKRRSYTTIPFRKIFTIPSSLVVPKKHELVLNSIWKNFSVKLITIKIIKGIVNFLSRILFYKRYQFFQVIEKSNLIIDCIGLTEESLLKIKTKTKSPIIANHPGSPDAFMKYFLKYNNFNNNIISANDRYIKFCSMYDGLIFQSQDQVLEAMVIDSSIQSKCFVLKPSCNEDEVLTAYRLKTPFEDNRSSIVCIGSIQERKAQKIALEIFNRIKYLNPKADLHFVGGGSLSTYELELRLLTEEYGLTQRVFFHGHRNDYLRYMKHAKVLIQTSKSEGVSRVLREAMLMKTPIITFAISGTKELLNLNEALLIDPFDIIAFSKALGTCLNDSQVLKKLSDNAFKKYLSSNSKTIYKYDLLTIFDEILGVNN